MIRVEFDPSRLSDEQRALHENWLRRARSALEKVASQTPRDLDSSANVWREFKAWLAEHFFSLKCGYCEGPIDAQTTGAAEHWRPKSSVEELDGEGQWRKVHDQSTQEAHRGYWWLAFAWQNLVPGCNACNQAKGTKFPIAGKRVFHRDVAEDVATLDQIERPLLLHPCGSENPAMHIGFRADGEAYAKGGSVHGGTTIRVVDLNRWGLIKARKKALRGAQGAFAMACAERLRSLEEVDLVEQMRDWDSPSAHYSQAVTDGLCEPEGLLREDLQRRHAAREARA